MTTDAEIKPALTREQWSFWHLLPISDEDRAVIVVGSMVEKDFHGAAAHCLYGQPFGFTRADLEALRLAVDPSFGVEGSYGAWEDSIRSLATRIAALLPPE